MGALLSGSCTICLQGAVYLTLGLKAHIPTSPGSEVLSSGFLQYEIFRDTATFYLRSRRSWRGRTQPKFVICANASLRYVFRSSEVWDLGQGRQRVCLTEGLSSITGAISVLSHITSDGWVKAVSFGAQPKLISNELMLALPLHVMYPHLKSRTLAPAALVLAAFVTGYNLFNIIRSYLITQK